MDSERPASSRTPGQPNVEHGIRFSFTATGETAKSEFDAGGRDSERTGLRPYHHLADGDGR